MKNILGLLAIAIVACTLGCEVQKVSNTGDATTSEAVAKVSLESNLCGACGCCADCDDCCKGEKCDCGMQKGSALCCTNVKPAEGVVYCKDCGFDTKSESCCADSNTECKKCGLAEGSPICCKVKSGDHDHDEAGHHDHDGDGHDHDEHK